MTTTGERAANWVVAVNGHDIYRARDGVLYDVWTDGVGFWAFALPLLGAYRLCESVSAN